MLPDLSKTLEQIENSDWGEPEYSSYLVTRCHALRKQPLKNFSVEDLRLLIGQNISLETLMPLAINELKQNILAEGHYYPGDLLKNVLESEGDYWKSRKEEWAFVKLLCEAHREVLNRNGDKSILEAIDRFGQIHAY